MLRRRDWADSPTRRRLYRTGRAPLSIHPLEPRSADSGHQPYDDRPSASSQGRPHAAATGPGAASLTYESYFGLREKPFSLSADPRFLYRSPSHAPAFDDLDAAIRRREGLIVLTGDIGTGKTTLCRAVLEQLDRKTFSTFVPDPFLSRNDLLKMILIDFGVMSVDDLKSGRLQGASRPDLSYPLYEFLDSLVPLQAFAVLVIDEAQNLSLPLLEEIRILSDLERREKLLQVVLVGQPEFRSQIKLPQMRQLDQRISVRCELQPLSRVGVTGYVSHRLAVAGGSPDRIEFDAEALDLVHDVSAGIPRVINLVCDRSLHYAWHDRVPRVDARRVRRALADLDVTGHSDRRTVATAPRAPSAAYAGTPAAAAPEAPPTTETPPAPALRPSEPDPLPPPRGLFESLAPPTGETEPAPGMDMSGVDLSALLTSEPPPADGDGDGTLGLSAMSISDPLPVRPVRPSRVRPRRPEEPLYRGEGTAAYVSPLRRVLMFVVVLALVGFAGAVGLGYLTGSGPFGGLAGPPPQAPSSSSSSSETPPARAPLEPEPAAAAPGPPSGASPLAAAAPSGFVIEVALFREPVSAGVLVEQLEEAGYRAYQRELNLGDRGQFRQVLVGPYAEREAADADVAAIRRIPGYADARVR